MLLLPATFSGKFNYYALMQLLSQSLFYLGIK